MELREEQSEGPACNPIEEKCDQCSNKTVSGRGLSVAPIGVRIDPCATTARACFKVAYIHAFVPYPTSRSANRVARRAASDAAQWASNAARISQSSISIFPRVTRRSHSPPCAQSNAPALDCCLCGQLKLQGAARSIEPQSRFLASGGCHLMRNRFPRNCRILLGSLENVVLLTGDRKFESIPLQQRVRCELSR
jgi:hypothetical protein